MVMNPISPKEPTQVPPQPTQARKGIYIWGKDKMKGGINTSKQAMETQNTTSRSIPPCAICDISGHDTYKYPRLLELKQI
jgi:hypothetical protein